MSDQEGYDSIGNLEREKKIPLEILEKNLQAIEFSIL